MPRETEGNNVTRSSGKYSNYKIPRDNVLANGIACTREGKSSFKTMLVISALDQKLERFDDVFCFLVQRNPPSIE